jgi:hypothetical protein
MLNTIFKAYIMKSILVSICLIVILAAPPALGFVLTIIIQLNQHCTIVVVAVSFISNSKNYYKLLNLLIILWITTFTYGLYILKSSDTQSLYS